MLNQTLKIRFTDQGRIFSGNCRKFQDIISKIEKQQQQKQQYLRHWFKNTFVVKNFLSRKELISPSGANFKSSLSPKVGYLYFTRYPTLAPLPYSLHFCPTFESSTLSWRTKLQHVSQLLTLPFFLVPPFPLFYPSPSFLVSPPLLSFIVAPFSPLLFHLPLPSFLVLNLPFLIFLHLSFPSFLGSPSPLFLLSPLGSSIYPSSAPGLQIISYWKIVIYTKVMFGY